MKKYLFIIILIPFFCVAQGNSFNFEQNVTGIISRGEGTYLILEQGFIKLSQTDIYTEYYRQIYKDSTLVNPNTELKDDFSFTIIPYLAPSTFKDRIDFSEPLKLGIFLQLNKSGEYQFTSFGESYIDSIRTK